ncbi:ssDNA endonuclease and repair protein rad10 [Savitreella phatthalungensis]
MADEYGDDAFDSLGAAALDRIEAASGPKSGPQSYPKQPVPNKQLRPGFNAVIVNERQKGNPVLDGIKNVPWEHGDIEPDYVLGATCCAFFLSLRYHKLHPEYIYSRMSKLGRSQFSLRILLVLCDVDNHADAIRELTKTSIVNNYTLIIAWSTAEAGRYLEAYKALEGQPPTTIRERVSYAYSDQVTEAMTSVRAVNKSDALSLIGTFGSFGKSANASADEVANIPGWGPQKVKNWTAACQTPFRIKTGTSRQQHDELLLSQTQPKQRENPQFARGEDHSISAAEREILRHQGNGAVTADNSSAAAGDNSGEQSRPAALFLPDDDTTLPLPEVSIVEGGGQDGASRGLEQGRNGAAARGAMEEDGEDAGVFAALARFRAGGGA